MFGGAPGASNQTASVPLTPNAGFPPRSRTVPTTVTVASFAGEAVVLDDLPKLRERDTIRGPEANLGGCPLERDFRRLHSVELQNGHAHGVGAERSIHSEYLQIDLS